MSQIPAINSTAGMHIYNGKPSRPYFKDTDSKYVRLAKERGVKDLLKHDETSGAAGAVPYNRVNWFYLEDNAAEDARKQKNVNWSFGAPDYMCNVSSATKSGSDEINEDDFESSNPRETAIDPANIKSAGLNKKYEHFDHPFIHNYETSSEHKDKDEYDEVDTGDDQFTERNIVNNIVTSEPLPVTKQIVKAIAHPQQWKNPITQTEISGDSPMKGTGRKCCPRENACTSMSKLLSFGYAQDWYANKKDPSIESDFTSLKP